MTVKMINKKLCFVVTKKKEIGRHKLLKFDYFSHSTL